MNDKKKIGVMIAIPVRHWDRTRGLDQLHPDHQATMAELAVLNESDDCPYYFQIAVMDGGLVRARNKIVAGFLKTDCRWLLTWDDDICATSKDVLKLLSHKQPIVAAMYCRRSATHSCWVANFLFEVKLQKAELLQVVEVGTGLKLFHREVFTELIRLYPAIQYTDRDSGEKMWAFFQQAVVDGDLLSEDYYCDYLCRRVRIAIWVDTNLKLKHRHADGILYPDGDWPPIPGIDS